MLPLPSRSSRLRAEGTIGVEHLEGSDGVTENWEKGMAGNISAACLLASQRPWLLWGIPPVWCCLRHALLLCWP